MEYILNENMTAQMSDINNPEVLMSLTKYLRLVNYIGAAQLYLKDNFFLETELKKEHLKERVLGHWGTVPGINFIYANLNILIKRHSQRTMLIAGPGHGYPALLANLYVEGSMGHFYPEYKWGKGSLAKLIKNFSWPSGFPSHSNPETPGVILEGGELGYSLGTAFGAAFDNPDLLVACIVGDGEAETATTAAAWHSNKFLNPKTSGAVLPIVHINKYKISGPTIYGTMSNDELSKLFEGYGYHPIIVEGDFVYEPMLLAMEEAYQKIKSIQADAREKGIIDKPKWPVILLITKKGWTGPIKAHNLMIEDSFRSHGIPLENTLKDEEEFQLLKLWLESYNVQELLDSFETPISQIQEIIPPSELRMGMNMEANGLNVKEIKLPDLTKYEVKVEKQGQALASNMIELSKYIRDVMAMNPTSFRVMSPDESVSNRISSLFEVTKRGYIWPTPIGSEDIAPDGRVMEILSENLLMAWMQGYVLTGRHSLFVSYEAFMMIVASMVDQYLKFMSQKKNISWRKPVPSLNIILTSGSWRQEHNGLSHQNPGFASSLLNNHTEHVDIHYPADANMLLATMEDCLKSFDKVNVIVTGKRDMPQYLSLSEAKKQLNTGIRVWSDPNEEPDITFAASGDYMSLESLAAIKIMKKISPETKIRFVNVSELSNFNLGDLNKEDKNVSAYFGQKVPVIFSYHGYPEDIKQLLFNTPDHERFHILGYSEKGTTTTPFDMLVLNNCSRYQLVIKAFDLLGSDRITPAIKVEIDKLHEILKHHNEYIKENGKDMPEVLDFKLVD